MVTPLFSILIPTLNRPELVKDAISSVLLQDCPASTYELVVSNNGGCAKTKKIVEGLQKDYLIRYIQPEQFLNMPDHWEWASRQLHGKYILILPDRRMLRQGALSLLDKLIQENANDDVEVVTWPDAPLSRHGVLHDIVDDEGFETYKSDTAINKFIRQLRPSDFTLLPLGLNSCVKREVLDQVRAKRGRVYSPFAPDTSSAFSILCVAENITSSNSYLSVSQGYQESNAGKTIRGDSSYYYSLDKEDRVVRYVPITEVLIWVCYYEEFFCAMYAFDKKIEWEDINPVFFYTGCWREISLRRVNQPFSPSVKKLIASYQAALDRESPERKLAVQVAMKQMNLWPMYAKQLLVKVIGQNLASKARATYHQLRGRKLYSNGLEACGFTQKIEFTGLE